MKMKVTTSDVARRAGVSQSAVSMILNRPESTGFSAETVRRVLSAAEELGYARKERIQEPPLPLGRKTLLIVCPVLSNPYYASLVQSIEQECVKKGYSAVVCNTYRDIRREQNCLAEYAGGNLSGIIFTFVPFSCELIRKISSRIPVVVIGDRNSSVSVDTVEIDSVLSGSLVAGHLLELGHRCVAFLSTTLDEQNAVRRNRLDGLRDTFRKKLPEGNVRVFSASVSSEEDLDNQMVEYDVGFRLAGEAMEDKKITALVAVNDMVAYGVIAAVQKAGYAVPKDYSICGFDNIFPSQFPSLSLTTVEHFIREKGREAVNILDARVRSGNSAAASITRVEYRPRLIVRKSTGKARLKE